MNCEETRRAVEERFDGGLELTEGLEPHLETCPACRAHRDRLLGLEAQLLSIPLEQPAPGLAHRITSHIEARNHPARRGAVTAAAALAVAAACILGWFYPLSVDWAEEWTRMDIRLEQFDWKSAGSKALASMASLRDLNAWQIDSSWAYATEGAQSLWDAVTTQFTARALTPSPALWTALAAAALLLIAFNGVQAKRLRSAPNGAGRQDTSTQP